MPVEYPVVIASIKEWVGKHKVKPASSVEVEGQPAVKKASFGDMLSMGLYELVSLAVAGGFALTTGGTTEFNKFFDSLDPALKEPLSALKGTFEGLTTNLPTGFQDAFTGFKDAFINPIAETFNGFRDGLTSTADELVVKQAIYADLQPTVAQQFGSTALDFGGWVKSGITSVKDYADGFTLGTSEFSLGDALDAANNSTTKFLETYVGITNAPSITDLAGTLVG